MPNPDESVATLTGWLALVAEAHRTGANARSVDGAVARRAFGGVNNRAYR